jgi:hypothetical protein
MKLIHNNFFYWIFVLSIVIIFGLASVLFFNNMRRQKRWFIQKEIKEISSKNSYKYKIIALVYYQFCQCTSDACAETEKAIKKIKEKFGDDVSIEILDYKINSEKINNLKQKFKTKYDIYLFPEVFIFNAQGELVEVLRGFDRNTLHTKAITEDAILQYLK